ncbi:MAG: tRNA pseudouridine(38-40) synthase TruA [Acidimicrobiia bacterium]
MPAYRLDVSYDGTDFHGYARQAGLRTVQEVLEGALATVIGPVETVVAGRTDAGVHAAHQVISFATEEGVDPSRLVGRLAKLLPPDVAVQDFVEVPPEFNARFDAVSRTYRYMVYNRAVADPLLRRTSWHVPTPLDIEEMRKASAHFVGRHDFASLCRRAEGRSSVRTVLAASWDEPSDGVLTFEVEGESFCHQMVRSMVALAIEAGRGKVAPHEVPAILEARDRNAAKGAAPARGLILWAVSYG